jgi:hypothetical protein
MAVLTPAGNPPSTPSSVLWLRFWLRSEYDRIRQL